MMDLPWPNLPDYFLSPRDLEQSLRTIRASALSRFPPPQPRPAAQRQVGGDRGGVSHPRQVGGDGGGVSRKPPRQRTQSETDRIARIFSSRP